MNKKNQDKKDKDIIIGYKSIFIVFVLLRPHLPYNIYIYISFISLSNIIYYQK